jgi:hypothetical protein
MDVNPRAALALSVLPHEWSHADSDHPAYSMGVCGMGLDPRETQMTSIEADYLNTALAPGSPAALMISPESHASAIVGFTGYARVRRLKQKYSVNMISISLHDARLYMVHPSTLRHYFKW